MSTEERKELKFIPAQVKIGKHIRRVYACYHCKKEGLTTPIVTAAMPTPPISGSLTSPSALAFVMNQKFVDGLPLDHQERQFERLR